MKTIKISLLFLLTIFIFSACSKKPNFPDNIILINQEIKSIIDSHDENYDLINDNDYVAKMNELGRLLAKQTSFISPHYAFGDLDGDNLPELVVFRMRSSSDMDDPGSLDLYTYNGDFYDITSSTSMNFDNGSYSMIIGKITENQVGLYMNNYVSSHSGISYCFILRDNSLLNLLEGSEIPTISIYTSNEIKDIDSDGILEYSVYVPDPESKDIHANEPDMMTVWYKLAPDLSSVILVQVDRIDYSYENTDELAYENCKTMLVTDYDNFLTTFNLIASKLSRHDNSELLFAYRDKQLENMAKINSEFENILTLADLDNSYSFLIRDYNLNEDTINDPLQIAENPISKGHPELVLFIQKLLRQGWRFIENDGKYELFPADAMYYNKFHKLIFNEHAYYLKIMATYNQVVSDKQNTIDLSELADSILLAEKFPSIFLYSDFNDEIRRVYLNSINVLLYTHTDLSEIGNKTLMYENDYIDKLRLISDTHKLSDLSFYLDCFIDLIEKNDYILDYDIIIKITDIINKP